MELALVDTKSAKDQGWNSALSIIEDNQSTVACFSAHLTGKKMMMMMIITSIPKKNCLT